MACLDRKRGKPDVCKSCGLKWTDHLGISGTCSKLEFAMTALKIIRTWAAFPLGIQRTQELIDIRDMCDKTLESLLPKQSDKQ